jgi:cold shock CspA family protein
MEHLVGIVKFFHAAKDFGYIATAGRDAYFRGSDCSPGVVLHSGSIVRFLGRGVNPGALTASDVRELSGEEVSEAGLELVEILTDQRLIERENIALFRAAASTLLSLASDSPEARALICIRIEGWSEDRRRRYLELLDLQSRRGMEQLLGKDDGQSTPPLVRERSLGVIKFFSVPRDFGFIADRILDTHFRAQNCSSGFTPSIGMLVAFSVASDRYGSRSATQVSALRDEEIWERRREVIRLLLNPRLVSKENVQLLRILGDALLSLCARDAELFELARVEGRSWPPATVAQYANALRGEARTRLRTLLGSEAPHTGQLIASLVDGGESLGVITRYSHHGDFGFIQDKDNTQTYFRLRHCEPGATPSPGRLVRYQRVTYPGGRSVATQVRVVSGEDTKTIGAPALQVVLNPALVTREHVVLLRAVTNTLFFLCRKNSDLVPLVSAQLKSWPATTLADFRELLPAKLIDRLIRAGVDLGREYPRPKEGILSRTEWESEPWITPGEAFRALRAHAESEVGIPLEFGVELIRSVQAARERLLGVMTKGTPPAARLAWARTCLEFLLQYESSRENSDTEYESLSPVLRDSLLVYHSSRAELEWSQSAWRAECRKHLLAILWLDRFWDNGSVVPEMYSHRRLIVLPHLIATYLDYQNRLPLEIALRRAVFSGDEQYRRVGLQLLNDVANVSVRTLVELLDLIGAYAEGRPEYGVKVPQILDAFPIPLSVLLVETPRTLGSSLVGRELFRRAIRMLENVGEEEDRVIGGLIEGSRLVSDARHVASNVERANLFALAAARLNAVQQLARSTAESGESKTASAIKEVTGALEVIRSGAGLVESTLKVALPAVVFAYERPNVDVETREYTFGAKLRIIVRNEAQGHVPGVRITLNGGADYVPVTYRPEAVNVRPASEAVIEVECWLKRNRGDLFIEADCQYLGEGRVRSARSVVVMPAESWADVPNLYVLDPVMDHYRLMFTGRGRELKQVMRSAKGGGSVMVFGIRRVGKTSLLLETKRRLEAEGCIAVYFDARVWADEIVQNSVEKIELEICRGIQRETHFEGDGGHARITDCLRAMTPYLTDLRKNLIVILDEFDMILAHASSLQVPASQDPWMSLLSRIGALPPDARRVTSIIMAGHRRLGTEGEFGGKYLWHLKDLLAVELDVFSEDEAREYVVGKVGREYVGARANEIRAALNSQTPEFGALRFSPSVVSLVMRLTGRHPYYLSLICRELIEVMNEQYQEVVREDDLGDAVARAVATDRHVTDLWSGGPFAPEQFLPAQRVILEYLVKKLDDHEETVSSSYAPISSAAVSMNSSAFANSLHHLQSHQVLERQRGEEAYRFRVDLMRLILARKILRL